MDGKYYWVRSGDISTIKRPAAGPVGNSGKAKGGKDRVDKVLQRGVSIETGDLGRLAPAEAIRRVFVKAAGKPGIVGTIPGSPIGEPDKGRNPAIPQMPLRERRGKRCQTRGDPPSHRCRDLQPKHRLQIAGRVQVHQLGSLTRAETRPPPNASPREARKALPNSRGPPPKPQMSRSATKKPVADRREGAGSPIGEPDKGRNPAIPQMPLRERRGKRCQTRGDPPQATEVEICNQNTGCRSQGGCRFTNWGA